MNESRVLSQETEEELERALALYRLCLGHARKDPEASLTTARRFAELVGKSLYEAAGLERQARPSERADLNDLLTKIESGEVVPKHVSLHFRTLQFYGNFGSHDQGRASARITPEDIAPCIHALRQVARWYLVQHHKRQDLAHRILGTLTGSIHVNPNPPAIELWREQYWWAHRLASPKVLDLKALESIAARNEVREDEAQRVRDSFRRDPRSLAQAIEDALEDGFLEVIEADALENIRVDCCISAREAAQLVRSRRTQVVDCRAEHPDWLILGLSSPAVGSDAAIPNVSADAGRDEAQHRTPATVAPGHQSTRTMPGEPDGAPLPARDANAGTNTETASSAANALEEFLALTPRARSEILSRLISRFCQFETSTPGAAEKLRHGVSSCQIPAREPIAAAFDLTLMGSGTDAFIITSEALYVHNPWYSAHSGRHRTSWTELAAAKIKIADSEIVIDRGADSMFIWSWNEHKNIKRTLLVIQQYLHS